MYHLVYVSSGTHLFSEAELQDVLTISRRNNGKAGISGMLLYLDGNFIQVLEGEKEKVLTTHQRISLDPRHQGLITLLQGDIKVREFQEWSMGFRNLDEAGGKDLDGYSDFLNKRNNPDTRRSSALILLEHFRNINGR